MTHNPGDRVFAKIKGFSNWPARINPLPPDVQIPKGKLPVFFYGTYQVSFVPVKNIVSYEEFKDKWGKPKPNPQFMAAMEEIENNPGIFMLGEDPRAESFLLQFYNFKVGSCSKTVPSSRHVKAQAAYLSVPEATASVDHIPSGNGKNIVSHYWRNHSKSNRKDVSESLSETSSELSSGASRRDDSEDTHDVSEEFDNGNTTLINYSPDTVTPQNAVSPSGSGVQLGVAVTRLDSSLTVESDLHEASRLARKLQKKAVKKAMKKAAKREAKRLAKEAERAERRARREAKRELKRLHRLKKQRMLEEQQIELTMGNKVHQSSPMDPWLVHSHLDLMCVSTSRQVSPAVESPYDALIAAEFGGGDLSSMMDRSTSPLKLDDYEESTLPLDTVPSALTQDTRKETEEVVLPNVWSSVSPASLPFSPTISPVIDPKRTVVRSPDIPKIDYYKDVISGADSESEESLPQKRAKADRPHSPIFPTKQVSIDVVRSDHDRNSKPEPPTKQKVSSASKARNRHSRGPSQNRAKSQKAAATRRRRIVDSSGDSDSTVEGAESLEPKPHPRLRDPTAATVLSGESVTSKGSPLTNSASDHCGDTIQMGSVNQSKKAVNNIASESQVKSTASLTSNNDTIESSRKARIREDPPNPNSPGPTDVVTQLCHLCRELKASLVRGHENFSLAVQHLTRLTTIPARLPQLAQAWDVMDCIKKCRRYKLSAEVREAAQRTLRAFQAIQSSATKEELALTQSLLAAHLSRQQTDQPGKDATVPNNQSSHVQIELTTPTSVPKSTPPSSTVHNVPPTDSISESNLTSLQLSSTESDTKSSNLNADLAAKVDDMLSLIRATDQRMAAAASSHPRLPNKPQFTIGMSMDSLSGSSAISGRAVELGHNIRASAVAAATAHMHDEEDEESVVSRVEQVAAYEAASKVSSSVSRSPPPPPPPLPASAALITTTKTNSFATQPSEMSVDLDLDSRIELLMTGPKSASSRSKPLKCPLSPSSKLPDPDKPQSLSTHTLPPANTDTSSSIPSALLAQRQTIAEKIAANRASSLVSPVKSLLQSKLNTKPQQTPFSSGPPASKDDELYDLLGV